METFTIREAAERCEVSYQAMRRRVDRGSLQAVHKDGVRRIPRAELERAGLWPGAQAGAPAEVQRLQAENEDLRRELRELRLLPNRSTPSVRRVSASKRHSTKSAPRSRPPSPSERAPRQRRAR